MRLGNNPPYACGVIPKNNIVKNLLTIIICGLCLRADHTAMEEGIIQWSVSTDE